MKSSENKLIIVLFYLMLHKQLLSPKRYPGHICTPKNVICAHNFGTIFVNLAQFSHKFCSIFPIFLCNFLAGWGLHIWQECWSQKWTVTSGPEVFFKTCVAMKFVDDDDDDDRHISPEVTYTNPSVGCYYFLPGPLLPFQSQSITIGEARSAGGASWATRTSTEIFGGLNSQG